MISRGRALLTAAAVLLAAGTASASTASASTAAAVRPAAPVHQGTLRISGSLRDGATVAAAGLSWHPSALPAGWQLVSFEVGYSWQSCAAADTGAGTGCRAGADSAATPFAAQCYVVGQADAGRRLRLTETATEVVLPPGSANDFTDVSATVRVLSAAAAGAYPAGQPPASAFLNGTPERQTASDAENFQLTAPHANAADGAAVQSYRVDRGSWRPLPASRVLATGTLAPGPHQVTVRTANRAGATSIRFSWRVTPLPGPAACRGGCWYPQHLAADGQPMSWDWQIGRVTPLERTGAAAVDLYDLDGFLTTRAAVTALTTSWQAATLPHPKAICYLDLAWEDYRPDATPDGGAFPAATLGLVYYGYPEERWVDFRQLDELKPMLDARIAMCAAKGFDAVELDDIDGFDPPSTTGFQLTPGDVENFLAYAFNQVHRDGMTALWKNSPLLSAWGRQYTDGAVIEECYVSQACTAAQFQGSTQYGFTCSALAGQTPCGWDDFTTDSSARQPTGKWAGEAEYTDDDYVCGPGQQCAGARAFTAYCRAVEQPAAGFAAVLFDSDLDGATFDSCRRRS